MSFLTAAMKAFSGYEKGKRQRSQDDLASQYQTSQIDQARQAELDRQAELAETHRYNDADLAQRQRTIVAANRREGLDADGNPIPLPGYGAPVPLPVGAKGAPATPDQMVRHYSEQARIANDNYAKTGDPRWAEVAKSANAQAATFASATLNATRGDEIRTGKIPLEQAQAAYWKDRPAQFRLQLKSAEARAKATLGARYAAISQSAANTAARIQSSQTLAGMNINARESVALMTQIGILNGRNEQQAFQEAMQQQRLEQGRVNTTWQAQTRAIQAGGSPPPGYNPAGPPTVNLTMPSTQMAPPAITTINVTLPNGQKVTVPSVVPGRNPATPAPATKLPAADEVKRARAAGLKDDAIRAGLKTHGYSEAEINAALPPAAAHHNILGIPLPF